MEAARSGGETAVNTETAKQWAMLFTAFSEGRHVQVIVDGRWLTATSIQTDGWSPSRYRIKPKPVEFEVWYNPNPPAHLRNIIGASENCAADDDFWKGKGYTKIKVREVQD